MNAKNLVADDDTQCQKIKHVGKVMPYVGVSVFARTLRVEAI